MVFVPGAWLPHLPRIPDSISLDQFLLDEQFGRHAVHSSRDPYTCGIAGTSFNTAHVIRRIDHLSRALGKRLGFSTSEGTEWSRVVCIYSQNTIDYIPVAASIHRLSGVVTPASPAYSAEELEHQIRSSGSTAVFTCLSLLQNALKAAKAANIPNSHIFILRVANEKNSTHFLSIDDLISEGESLPDSQPQSWARGQGKRQTAFLCYSSGTSGLPKAVMVSHYNIIANILQISALESLGRKAAGVDNQVALGVLPFSHVYGLTVIALLALYRGDQIVVLPRFELGSILKATQTYHVQQLNVVPPILVEMINRPQICSKYDLSSIRVVYCGAAPLGKETVDALLKMYPKWIVSQGYGMTEASPGVCSTSEIDSLVGTSGCLLPNSKAKLINASGEEVIDYETRGNLLVQSPSVVLGYLNNERANSETFTWDDDGRWLMTGDEVIVRKSEQGNDHFVIVDRIKELIKVKGHQVAPAELEAHLLTHPLVSDCAVIPIMDARAGELPKAIVVKATNAMGLSNTEVTASICKYVEDHKARHKWLKGGVEYIDAIPKSPSGKILRRLLKDKQTNKREHRDLKL